MRIFLPICAVTFAPPRRLADASESAKAMSFVD
jgi:hypothetical protein